MKLSRDLAASLLWIAHLASVFFSRRPMTTAVVVGASALGLVASIVAFVLPIKIVLLAGSDGVSEWFSPFVRPEQKGLLLAALTTVAILSFFASIALRALCDNLAASASRIVLRGANELAVVGDQGARAQTVYAQFAEIVAGGLFCVAGLVVIGATTPLVVVVVVAALVLQFLVTGLVLEREDPLAPGRIARFIEGDLRDFLNTLSSLDFLAAFAVLLYPFVWGGGGNVLAALVSIIVVRRILGVLVDVILKLVSMVRRKSLIDALVFREQQYLEDERHDHRALREMFERGARHERVERELRAAGVEPNCLSVKWRDSRLIGLSLLAIHDIGPDEKPRNYLQQIYLPNENHRLENEAVLFSYIPRATLHAPPIVASFSVGPYGCQICEAGGGAPVDQSEWGAVEARLQESLMNVQPPSALVQAYIVSHPILGDRLTDAVLARLTVAVDDDAEADHLERFRVLLPTVREKLARLPLYVRNPEAVCSNCYYGPSERPWIMTWGQWRLDPVPAGLVGDKGGDRLQTILDEMRRNRWDVAPDIVVDDLRLGLFAASLERLIRSNLLNEALSMIPRLLSLPILEEARSARRVDAGTSRSMAAEPDRQ